MTPIELKKFKEEFEDTYSMSIRLGENSLILWNVIEAKLKTLRNESEVRECVKASLEKAANNTKQTFNGVVVKSSITSDANIVLL